MNYSIRILIIFWAAFLTSGCQHRLEADITEELLSVRKTFMELKEQGKLNGLSKNDSGGNVSFFVLNKTMRKQSWFREIRRNFPDCERSYLAMVAIHDRQYSYLFCLTGGQLQLAGSYAEYDGHLVPLRP